MAITLHRCNNMWVKVGGHPCWRVQKALDEAGIEYELDTLPVRALETRRDRAAHAPEEVPVDRVRGRLDLPRGVEGDGAADRRRQARRGASTAGRPMSFIVPEEIEGYAEAHSTPPTELLAELAEETKATLDSPQMLTGKIEGRLLEQLVHALQAKRVLELGTYSGYSSLSMAAGLPEGGSHRHLRGLGEARRGRAAATTPAARTPTGSRSIWARRSRRSSGSAGSGTSSSSTPTRRTTRTTTRRLLPRLAATGLMAIDNTLWSGRVLDDERRRGDDARDPRAERPHRRRRARRSLCSSRCATASHSSAAVRGLRG